MPFQDRFQTTYQRRRLTNNTSQDKQISKQVTLTVSVGGMVNTMIRHQFQCLPRRRTTLRAGGTTVTSIPPRLHRWTSSTRKNNQRYETHSRSGTNQVGRVVHAQRYAYEWWTTRSFRPNRPVTNRAIALTFLQLCVRTAGCQLRRLEPDVAQRRAGDEGKQRCQEERQEVHDKYRGLVG